MWLFTGRSDLDPVANESGLQKVFDPALPPMTAADLRGLVVSLAPQAVRDAILLRDRQGQSGEPQNPYVSDLAERAEGLPLYVVLMLEWLASMDRPAEVKAHIAAALEDPQGTIPAGLSALYAKLVEGWGGLGVKLTKKTPLLCLLAVAAEPLDVESLAELCFQRPPNDDEEASHRVAICEEILTAFSPVLWSAPDHDGIFGWRLRHDSFRGYLADPDNPELRPVFDEARDTMATRGAKPEKARYFPLVCHLYRHGISYLRADRDNARADKLLADFEYLYGRLEVVGSSGVDPLLVDYEEGMSPTCREWAAFIRTHAHFLRRDVPGWGPHRILHQLTFDEGDGPVTQASHTWSEAHRRPPIHRSRVALGLSGGPEIVFEGHVGGVRGAFQLKGGRVLSWSYDKALRTWDLNTGAPIAVFNGHTFTVTGAVELMGGQILSWSWAGQDSLRTWDSGTGAALHVFEGHLDGVLGALQLSDGRVLSWSGDGTMRIWDARHGCSGPCHRGPHRHRVGRSPARQRHPPIVVRRSDAPDVGP